MLKLKQKRR